MMKENKSTIEKEIDQAICCTTGKLYVLANNMGFDIEDFSYLFLTSNFCARAFDTTYSRYQTEDEDYSMDLLLKEITPKKNKMNKLSDDLIFWIGYIYRYIYIQTGISSKILATKIPFSYLSLKAYGLSTMDELNAADVICNNCKIKGDIDGL